MNKTLIMWFGAGWLLGLFLPPSRVVGMIKGKQA